MEAVRVRNESAEFHSAEEFLERQSLLVLPGRGGGRKLRHACQHGKLEEARELLACGCQPTSTDEAFERTALHWAALSGDVEVGELLFTHPSTISLFDAQDLSKFTPLHIAAERGHTGFIELLIRHRADPLLRTSAGNTPLHYAAFSNHIETAQLILSTSISNSKDLDLEFDVTLSNMRNNDRQTPIELAQSRGHLLLASRLEDILEDFVRPIIEHNEMLARHGLLVVNHRIQSAYLESINQTIAENVASRPPDRRGLRGFETSPWGTKPAAAQQLRDRIQEHRGIQIHRLQPNYTDFNRPVR
jgi:ankyrin repeat protein